MSMFAKAKAVNVPKAKAAGKDEVQLYGLETLAELDALIKALTTMKSTLDVEVKGAAFDRFVQIGKDNGGKRPDSFRGIDGKASASIELRKRSTASVLTQDEQDMMTKLGIPFEKMIGMQKMFGINPIYSENTDLLAKVETALAGVVPEDFIVVQEETSKMVVTDESVEMAFKKNIKEVIKAVTTLAIKPKLAVTDIGQIMDSVKAMITDIDTVDSIKGTADAVVADAVVA